ncbi:hypothetical protein HK105_208996 [Polyrhizophydium stewartii]|uniref:Phosphofructokinase domain-containing protein n=1 Tax=Polyrhizophydium stewartii TaxID=2732419 RepID=A0ABR4MW99_9FUNG
MTPPPAPLPTAASADAGAWRIENLGPCTVPSPVPATMFVPDDDAVLLDPSVSPSSPNSSHVAVEKAGPRKNLFFKPAEAVAAVVTCGGLCPALNDVVRAIVNTLTFRYGVPRILGFRYGFEGIFSKNTVELTPSYVRDIHRFGGTILGTSRGPQPIGALVDNLVELGVSVLFTIGGDGTQRGAVAIANEIRSRNLPISVVGVPKTIDNDIAYVERTFGFETAVQLAQDAIQAVHEEARSARNGIGIVKLMGRESGFIALHAALASGDVNLLLLPETKFTFDAVVNAVVERFKTRAHCVIVVSEGAGQELCQAASLGTDASGNKKFADIGVHLKDILGARLSALKIEHTIKYIDPSYTIRSAPPVASDAIFALQLGQMAAHAAMAGKTAMIVGMIHGYIVHAPMARAVESRKKVDTRGQDFQSFLDASGMALSLE